MQVDRLVITHKDRLLRFGSELIFALCEHFGVEVVILNRKEDSSFEEDLAKDVLEINERVFRQVVRFPKSQKPTAPQEFTKIS